MTSGSQPAAPRAVILDEPQGNFCERVSPAVNGTHGPVVIVINSGDEGSVFGPSSGCRAESPQAGALPWPWREKLCPVREKL